MTDPLNITIAGRQTSIRPGTALLHELTARSRGPLAATIKRDLARYYELLAAELPSLSLDVARATYQDTRQRSLLHRMLSLRTSYPSVAALAIADAIERADLLVSRDGLSLDDALRQVGLVRE